jgi:hypothetical protein
MFWARFVGAVYGPTLIILALVVAGHWNKSVVKLANVPMEASMFVWISIVLLGSNSLLFGGALALWLRRRGSLSFDSYEEFASRAISFVSRSLAVVWLGVPVAGFLSADPENALVSAVISMLFGIGYQAFVGFPVLFGTVFFVGWAVFRKTEAD